MDEDTTPPQDIEPWEKTDDALAAAAELMPVCQIAHGIGEDGLPIEDRQTVEAIVDAGPDETGDA
ncbi:hypothetical protein ABZ671_18820 [Micromonospora sp. NPDC006766]|uniref:hypothetical protein n=1 Tax=Micromonospora sp. NPDC006766 TaxID=3154778 RepID=UPI0033E5E63B